MKQMTTTAMREANGGIASLYVYCPVCGYKKRNRLWEIFHYSNSTLRLRLSAEHYTYGNIRKYGANNKTQAVHK